MIIINADMEHILTQIYIPTIKQTKNGSKETKRHNLEKRFLVT